MPGLPSSCETLGKVLGLGSRLLILLLCFFFMIVATTMLTISVGIVINSIAMTIVINLLVVV